MEQRKRQSEMRWGLLLVVFFVAVVVFQLLVYGLDYLLALLVVLIIGAVVWKVID